VAGCAPSDRRGRAGGLLGRACGLAARDAPPLPRALLFLERGSTSPPAEAEGEQHSNDVQPPKKRYNPGPQPACEPSPGWGWVGRWAGERPPREMPHSAALSSCLWPGCSPPLSAAWLAAQVSGAGSASSQRGTGAVRCKEGGLSLLELDGTPGEKPWCTIRHHGTQTSIAARQTWSSPASLRP
jgi:hypothetical protein